MASKPSPRSATATAEAPEYKHRVEGNPMVSDIQDAIYATWAALTAHNEKFGSKVQAPENSVTLLNSIGLARENTEDPEIKAMIAEWDAWWEQKSKINLAIAKRVSVLTGRPLHSEPTKPEEHVVTSLKDKRKQAKNNSQLLARFAEAVSGDDRQKINDFLSTYALPGVGTDTVTDVTAKGTSTPKYRVDVRALVNGKDILTGDDTKGFTRAVNALRKFTVDGEKLFARGTAPDQDYFRSRWEERAEDASTVSWTQDLGNGVQVEYFVTAR